MPLYQCVDCNFNTKLKSNYTRHLKTKKHLNNLKVIQSKPPIQKINLEDIKIEKIKLENDSEFKIDSCIQIVTNTVNDTIQSVKQKKKQNKKYNCDYCDSKFTTFAHKRRHEKNNCSENATKMVKAFKEKEEAWLIEKQDLYKKMDILLQKVGNTTNIQTNNIQLNNYGKEDLSHLTSKVKTNLIKQPYGMIPKMVEYVHFNDDKPENKNILVSNIRDNKIQVYENGNWTWKDKNKTISNLIDSNYYILDEYYDTINTTLSGMCKTNYLKFKTFYEEKDKELYEKLRKETDLVLLNNKKK